MELEKLLSNVPKEVWGLAVAVLFLVLAIIFYFLRKLFSGKEKEKTGKKGTGMKNYWNDQRLLEYFKNSQKDPKTYGYTIFSGYP